MNYIKINNCLHCPCSKTECGDDETYGNSIIYCKCGLLEDKEVGITKLYDWYVSIPDECPKLIEEEYD